MKNQCINCKNIIKYNDSEEEYTCLLSVYSKNPSLIVLGIKGCCPYHKKL